LTFQDAQLKLLDYVRDRIQSGELTERGLARLIGISQPHAHNVLKGARNLSPEIFDSMLKYFQISLPDLAPIGDLEASLKRRRAPAPEVPFLESAIGPGMPWPGRINWRRTFPLPYQSRSLPAGLVMVRLARDPDMHATLAEWDVALLDTTEDRRSDLSPEGLYVVARDREAVLRYIRAGARCFYLPADATWGAPSLWEQLRIPADGLLELVKARVRWLGRERDRDLPQHLGQSAPQSGRFLYDPISS
jgi:transcriptional regulator with XRE-family HTH domain